MNITLAEIVSKIKAQGNKPDISFLKDNPEAQLMLLLALLSNNNNNNQSTNDNSQNNDQTPTSSSSASSLPSDFSSNMDPANASTMKHDDLGLKRKMNNSSSKKVGRKPVTSEDEDSDDPKSKRKAQNRAAQRAFRERKENHIRLLEERVKELEKQNLNKNVDLLLENKQLKEMIARLQNENAALLNSAIVSSFDFPLSSVSIDSEERPQKIIRSANDANTLPVNHLESPVSSEQSISSKSQLNTPETQYQLSIDDILGINNTSLPSHTLLDHYDLLGLNVNKLNDYQIQLENLLNQSQSSFASDPAQFDLFYPTNNNNDDDANAANSVITTTNTTTTDSSSPEAETKQEEHEVKGITNVWDKLSEHSRFNEIDMDALCEEMCSKAIFKDSAEHDEEFVKLVHKYYPTE
ncbi:uncharacterized protein BX663DRAFT_514228 [Cokeromyces recurvatus]|uniref:uncharacterized protein n=1 Tax=Cokeromyces recurvatus TaxID=90255 RepID=UPI00221F69D2|nr:uncharacterized protein BX663DRAFT_514228 [Cokeromyces recurvatus]KAI7901367.1 hypothetical protein BX663DRAFT_514228 [Cokeromyces recurvatus]